MHMVKNISVKRKYGTGGQKDQPRPGGGAEIASKGAYKAIQQGTFFIIGHTKRYVKQRSSGRTGGDDGEAENEPQNIQENGICDFGDQAHDRTVRIQ